VGYDIVNLVTELKDCWRSRQFLR